MKSQLAGQSKWNHLTMEYIVQESEEGIGIEIREIATRSVSETLLPPTPENLRRVTEFAKLLAEGVVFADNLPELAEDFRTEQA